MSHDCLLIFALRHRQLEVLELFSFLPSRASNLSVSEIILLAGAIVLFEIQCIRVERLVIPNFEQKHAAVAH